MGEGDPQRDSEGRLRNLLTIEGLREGEIVEILDSAESFLGLGERTVKKIPILRGRTLVNLFYENSTRTRSTFELAAKRL
jgi:aspartate carbamoyltransferase catalytic subunit